MSGSKHPPIIAIMGATATGKSDAAITLAHKFDGEIVSMDSRQVYRRLDIGTGKVTRDQLAEIPHHLIDIIDADESSSTGRHVAMAESAVADIVDRGRLPMLVGGTGLYYRAFFGGLIDVEIPTPEAESIRASLADRSTSELYEELLHKDEQRASELGANDRVRITRALELMAYTGKQVSELFREQRKASDRYRVFNVVLSMPRELLRERIAQRTRAMFHSGWGEEVRRLLASGLQADDPAMKSLGYSWIAEALSSGHPPESVEDDVIRETQQFAKRQETFFRSVEHARWIDVSEAGWASRLAHSVGEFLAGEST